MDPINERAARWGIDTQYYDAFGNLCSVQPEVLDRFVNLFARSEEPSATTTPVAHEKAYQGPKQERLWGIAVQLYGVRSQRNWGHGDFTDLAALIDIAAEQGAAAVGLNPLHALFDDKPDDVSPYSPNSRLFLNTLYIDVESVPGFPGIDAASLHDEIERLRSAEFVNYEGVARIKAHGLRLAYDNFRKEKFFDAENRFEAFRRERSELLRRYALFELLRRRHGMPWQDWPADWRDVEENALQWLWNEEADEFAFFEFVQWVAHEQLSACVDRIRERSLPIGLYLDIAVGVSPAGFDAWHERETLVDAVSVGAPPDTFNLEGQNWGLAGTNPFALQRQEFEPFRCMLRASMRYAAAIRLDHALGLKRLFMIPKGMSAKQGAYVRFPFESLLAIVAQESQASRCIVIGEDLGTVPEGFRETLAEWGLWSYKVMMFEREHDGRFRRAEDYQPDALATFNTHDLATYVGWASHHDLKVKRELGLDPGESDENRAQARQALRNALGSHTPAEPEFHEVAAYLARMPSRLVVVAMEDLLGLADQPNVPGTVHEHPNWRRRLPVTLEEIGQGKPLAVLADIMAAAGRSFRNA